MEYNATPPRASPMPTGSRKPRNAIPPTRNSEPFAASGTSRSLLISDKLLFSSRCPWESRGAAPKTGTFCRLWSVDGWHV